MATYNVLYHKHMRPGSKLMLHDREATLRAIELLAFRQGLGCEVRTLDGKMGTLREALSWADAFVVPYPDAQTSSADSELTVAVASYALAEGKLLINLLTDVDMRFANLRTDLASPLLAQYSHIWYTQESEAVAKAAFPQAVLDWPLAQWSHFPQTQLGFAEALRITQKQSESYGKAMQTSWLYDCSYYGIHKEPRVARLREYLNSLEFASACYGSQVCGASQRHVDTGLRLSVDSVLSSLLPNAKFSLYVTCPGHYNSACFRLVEAALAGRACLIDVASAETGSFGLDECFFVRSSADVARMCAKPNEELAALYELYLEGLLSWCEAPPDNCADLQRLKA